jgi:hypothetical protein
MSGVARFASSPRKDRPRGRPDLIAVERQLNLHRSVRLNLRQSFIGRIPSVVYNHNASGFIVLHPFAAEKT